jgi:U3 small nucleolar ribonucleoprotein protein LCP5
MPYTLEDDGGRERQKRKNQRMRQSELAQTLRSEYGEAPEQADVHGGSEYGRQREAARRMAEREAEKIQIEEDNFIRLTTSRKEKKERNRLMREESSNLAAIADLGNVVRGVSSAFEEDSDGGDGGLEGFEAGRYSNGKRRRTTVDEATGRSRKKSGRARQPKNEFQQALYGKPEKSKKKKR